MHLRSCTTCLFCLMWCSIFGSAWAQDSARVLTINTAIIPPYNTVDHKGFEDLLATEVYKRAGYKIKRLLVNSERALLNINIGLEDGCMSRISGLQRLYPNLRRMKEHAVEWKFVAFTKDKNISITSWESLAPYNVAYLQGWKIFDINVKTYKSLKTVRTPKQLYRLLDLGRSDVVLHALRPGQWTVKQLGLDNITASEHTLAVRKKYFYLNKKHANILASANDALIEIKRDGTYQRMYNNAINNIQ